MTETHPTCVSVIYNKFKQSQHTRNPAIYHGTVFKNKRMKTKKQPHISSVSFLI